MSAHLIDWSENADTYWYARGGLCILSELVGSQGVFMETVTKEISSGKTNYNIVQFDPESTSIPGYTAYYARQSDSGTGPNYSTYQYVRFSIGNPNNQGNYHYIIEYDFT